MATTLEDNWIRIHWRENGHRNILTQKKISLSVVGQRNSICGGKEIQGELCEWMNQWQIILDLIKQIDWKPENMLFILSLQIKCIGDVLNETDNCLSHKLFLKP